MLKSIIRDNAADFLFIFRKNDCFAVFCNVHFCIGYLGKRVSEVFFMIDGNMGNDCENACFFEIRCIVCAAHSGLQNDKITACIRKQKHADRNRKLEFRRVLFVRKAATYNLKRLCCGNILLIAHRLFVDPVIVLKTRKSRTHHRTGTVTLLRKNCRKHRRY